MGNDKCNCLATPEWPQKCTTHHNNNKKMQHELNSWANLPTVVLHDIFTLLSHKDRLNGSSVCHQWRHALYHPSFWNKIEIDLNPSSQEMQRSCYLISAASHLVRHATIKYFSFSMWCIYELTNTLKRLATSNYNLKSLTLEPSHCNLLWPESCATDEKNELAMTNFLDQHVIEPLVEMCPRLEGFSLGCCEQLCNNLPQFLNSMVGGRGHARNVEMLGLASVKDDPGNYLIIDVNVRLFESFPNLKVLSVDYDYVSDEFLESLRGAKELERLVVHIHGLWDGHEGTTDRAWEDFRICHPKCLLRLTLIHAYEAIHILGNEILRRSMPLSHLKVFFCEALNTHTLDLLSSWYAGTLQSIVWVDSRTPRSIWSVELLQRELPDPFVMAAWSCFKLEEIVLLGYEYFAEDIVAIARLRGHVIKNMVVAQKDVVLSTHENFHRDLSEKRAEISESLGYEWAPLSEKDVHPVIKDATAGDSDHFLMPFVLADLK